jgi:hypothetical protein
MKVVVVALAVACTGCSFFMRSTPKEPCPSMIAPIIDSVAVATIVTSTVVNYDPDARGAYLFAIAGALLTLPWAIATTYGWSRISNCG